MVEYEKIYICIHVDDNYISSNETKYLDCVENNTGEVYISIDKYLQI
jgi:hypothetical protein